MNKNIKINQTIRTLQIQNERAKWSINCYSLSDIDIIEIWKGCSICLDYIAGKIIASEVSLRYYDCKHHKLTLEQFNAMLEIPFCEECEHYQQTGRLNKEFVSSDKSIKRRIAKIYDPTNPEKRIQNMMEQIFIE
jgi:hypothetical protein